MSNSIENDKTAVRSLVPVEKVFLEIFNNVVKSNAEELRGIVYPANKELFTRLFSHDLAMIEAYNEPSPISKI